MSLLSLGDSSRVKKAGRSTVYGLHTFSHFALIPAEKPHFTRSTCPSSIILTERHSFSPYFSHFFRAKPGNIVSRHWQRCYPTVSLKEMAEDRRIGVPGRK
jgi:hypothetical protein